MGVRLPSTVIKTEDILNKRVGKETGEYESGEYEIYSMYYDKSLKQLSIHKYKYNSNKYSLRISNEVIMPSIIIGKDGVIHTMVYRVWWAAFEADLQQYGIGYASALGWVSGIIIIVFTIILFKTQKYWVYYDN